MGGMSLRNLMSNEPEDEAKPIERVPTETVDAPAPPPTTLHGAGKSRLRNAKSSIGFLLADEEDEAEDEDDDQDGGGDGQSEQTETDPSANEQEQETDWRHLHHEPANGKQVGAMPRRFEALAVAGHAMETQPSAIVLERAWPLATPAMAAAASATVTEPTTTATAPLKRKKKRKARICTEPGCQKYVVDHGLCIRHGGGKRCNVDGCDCRAQNRGLCWKHGGFTICKVDGCTKRAKSRGICWSHGGGTRCKADGCAKIAVSQGKCWAHGGGKRCTVDGCRKPASERTNNCCTDHFNQQPVVADSVRDHG